jgi:hypothetical protein
MTGGLGAQAPFFLPADRDRVSLTDRDRDFISPQIWISRTRTG